MYETKIMSRSREMPLEKSESLFHLFFASDPATVSKEGAVQGPDPGSFKQSCLLESFRTITEPACSLKLPSLCNYTKYTLLLFLSICDVPF